ncbi:mechanosensitive ion channel family protein [Halalkalibacterium ligniniphilum]|uniref:mechanosensitive ion channel family protein n=1 Tax=Halalkalibacterium ligniniphilum TaxID=1134413 RepID=UPI00034ACC41|nr:mechanosensitive ion channel family protein [Halalkalibacterium ligniniphilum]
MSTYQWERFVQAFQHFNWNDYLVPLGIFVFFLVFRKIFTTYIFKLILRLSRHTKTELLTNILLAFEKPLRLFWVVIGTYLALIALPFPLIAVKFVEHIYRSLIIIIIGWGLFNYTGANSSIFFNVARRIDLDENSMLVPFLSKILRFIVLAVVFVVLIDEWGYEISGLIAGLGLGGLAFALAAQDTVGNFFGGIIIITEKPFKRGDWIETPSVEGTVEDITFRSTKIRTFSDSIVTVPNSTLANEPITNWSEMGKRRVTFNLGVSHSTTREVLEKSVKSIEHLLRNHEEVHQDLILVRFSEFGEFGYEIFVYYFTKTTAWAEWFRIKEEINFSIMEILAGEGISVAFANVLMENDSQEIEMVHMNHRKKEEGTSSAES